MSEHVFVDTKAGKLSVDLHGRGLPTVLWQSLFMDSRSWQRLLPLLPQDRRLVVITGPGHGTSGDPGHRYTLLTCAAAAVEVLDTLGIAEPVDWVGNAFGGHVGVRFATSYPRRLKSLVTICAPVQPLSSSERFRMTTMLIAHRFVGPVRFIVDAVVETMLAPTTRAHDPEAVALVRACVVDANRRLLRNAIVSISLRREDLAPLLSGIAAPTLMITGADDEGWTPDQQDAAIAVVPDGCAAVVPDAAYLAALERPDAVADLLCDFWSRIGVRVEEADR